MFAPSVREWLCQAPRAVLVLALLTSCGEDPADTRSAVEIPDAVFAAAVDQSGAEVFASLCSVCHGADGHGRLELSAPSIAGLPAWYIRDQLLSFRRGARGGDADPIGATMRAIAERLTRLTIRRIAGWIEDLPPRATTNTLGGVGSAGRADYAEHCMACHRFDASGDQSFGSPPLRVLPDWYMARQMRSYHAGLRGVEPADENGQKMVRVAGFVQGDEMLRDILAHIAELAQR